jgi:hypothetical protein
MKRNKSEPTPAWVVDYSAARARAIRWLGDRYLLAKPINRKRSAWRTLPPVLVSDAAAARTEY